MSKTQQHKPSAQYTDQEKVSNNNALFYLESKIFSFLDESKMVDNNP